MHTVMWDSKTSGAYSEKMASYGKDGLITDSDLSDLSDISEDDLRINELLDVSSNFEDDDCQYCVCGKP